MVGLTTVAGLVLVGTAVAVDRLRDDAPVATTDQSSLFKAATLEEGSLTTTERIDASVTLSETTAILHRIEGQSSSSVVGSGGSSSSTGTGAFPTNALAATSIQTAGTTDPCATATSSTTTTTGASDTGTTTTVTDTTSTDATTTTTSPATTTTVCDTSSTSTTSTSTTRPGETTTTVLGGTPTGGAPSGFPSGTSGGTSSGTTGSTSTGSTGSTARVTQTITSVIATGSEVTLGDVLYTVEGTKVTALAGSLPAWRTLDADVDDGQDVLQLELSLVALGYDPDGTMTVDTEFDDDTEAVVEAWQEGMGQEATGSVELGSVVFLPTTTTVTAVNATVGDEVGDGDTVLTVSAPAQSVVIDVPGGTESIIVPGLVVAIGDVEGTVSYLRSIERDGSVVVQAVIAPSAELEGATDGSTTTVQVVIEGQDGVLLVAAEALVSKLDGSYAVQVSTDGTTNPATATWVDVDLLGTTGSKVGIRGDGLTDGTTVLQPA